MAPQPAIDDRNHEMDPDALLRPSQVAQLLGLRPSALDAWRHRGRGPRFVRVSARCVRYRRRDLVSWTEAHLTTTTDRTGDAGDTHG